MLKYMEEYKELRPCTSENGGNDAGLLTTDNRFTDEEISQIGEWIRNNIRPSDRLYPVSSYGLKHKLEADTHIYMTNNEFKDAMFLAGYHPANPDALNWTWKISYLPEEIYNPNPFVNFLKMCDNYETFEYEDILHHITHDPDFPVFADHGIIRRYLENECSANSVYLDVFEEGWAEYQEFLNNKVYL